MIDYRNILRLYSEGHSQRAMERELYCSRHTISNVLDKAKKAGISWPVGDDVTNEMIQELLFPGKYALACPYTQPDFPEIHKELAKKGVTLTLLWEEYCVKVRAAGGIPYMYTQYCEKYRRWARVTKVTMRITHKPGDAVQVDWAGDPLYITDSVEPAYIFVAVLPCSWYTYAEVYSDMKTENWLLCHVHAFNYFGGVPRLLIPDNCRTAVSKNTRYETVLNKSYQELAEHYNVAVVPARVRKPDDKSAAEGSVRFVSTWITASLRDRKFFTIGEAKQAVAEKLEELNLRPFKKRPGCRLTAFEQEEKEFLKPLPLYTYEPSVWLHPKVGYDYLVSDGVNKYSIPFDLIGEKVDVRLTKHIVEVFYKQTKVAAHVRLDKPQHDPVVKPEHMPEAHRRYLGYNADEFTVWANSAGSNIAQTVQYFLNSGKEAEKGFKSCASLMKLEKHYGSKRLDDACERVLRLTSHPTVRNISVLCKSSAEKQPAPVKKEGGHGITRGAAYYNKGGKRDE